MRRPFLLCGSLPLGVLLLVVVVLGATGCGTSHQPVGGHDGGAARDSAVRDAAGEDGGVACGETTCGRSEVCCADCDGARFCSAGGCPLAPCPPPPRDAGARDAGARDAGGGGVPCGETVCGAEQSCCVDCDGARFCSAGGCPAMPCPPPPPPDGGTGDAGTVETCGGIAGLTCDAGQWCDYPEDTMCGAFDMLGECKPRPEGCPDVYMPVCGCDGSTHGNECEAHAAGVDVLHEGTCEDGPDCRTTGCPDGSSCTACEVGEYICLEDGMDCAL